MEDNINNYTYQNIGGLLYAEAQNNYLFLTDDRKRYVSFPMDWCDFEKALRMAKNALNGKEKAKT